MADKTLNVRLQLRYDSLANWQAIESTFVPKRGEVCVYEIPASSGQVANEPAVLMKVGDGTKTLQNLDWFSAKSADVYDWAKASVKPIYDAAEIQNLDEYIDERTAGGMRFRGVFNSLEEVTDPKAGDIAIVSVKEYIYGGDPAKWNEIGDETLYATKVELQNEANARTLADNALQADIDTKVDKEIAGTNGTAQIFNESDGGGAHFIHNDGSEAFVGVNDGGETGIMAQIYADKQVNGQWVGSRVNVYHNGIYYVSKSEQEGGTSKNDAQHEIAVRKDINTDNLSQGSNTLVFYGGSATDII